MLMTFDSSASRSNSKSRFGGQGSAKKGPTWCDNRLTIRQEERDPRVLAGLTTEMLRDVVVEVFLAEHEEETQRPAAEKSNTRPDHEVARANLEWRRCRVC
jgi:site-specific DNA recombinase